LPRSHAPQLPDRLRRTGQLAAQQRLHNHNCQSLGSRILQTLGAGLFFHVHIVVLNLAERPLIVPVYDLLENLEIGVK